MTSTSISTNNSKKRKEVLEEEQEESDNSSYAPSAIDVSFNYVTPKSIDYHALKRLIRQLFHTYSSKIEIDKIANHIIDYGSNGIKNGPLIGTVVKVEDDEDGDPFAFATIIDLSNSNKRISNGKFTIISWLKEILEKGIKENSTDAKSILKQINNQEKILPMIIHERMINMPPQIMPPLFKMTIEEMYQDEEMKNSNYILLFSRIFSLNSLENDENDDDDQDQNNNERNSNQHSIKKIKKSKSNSNSIENHSITKINLNNQEFGLFHPEDEILLKFSLNSFTFKFPPIENSDENFNSPIFGRILLIKNDKIEIKNWLKEMEEAFIIPS